MKFQGSLQNRLMEGPLDLNPEVQSEFDCYFCKTEPYLRAQISGTRLFQQKDDSTEKDEN